MLVALTLLVEDEPVLLPEEVVLELEPLPPVEFAPVVAVFPHPVKSIPMPRTPTMSPRDRCFGRQKDIR